MTPRDPVHPERVCWGCDKHCAAGDLACGEDKTRAAHPSELYGAAWGDPKGRRDIARAVS